MDFIASCPEKFSIREKYCVFVKEYLRATGKAEDPDKIFSLCLKSVKLPFYKRLYYKFKYHM